MILPGNDLHDYKENYIFFFSIFEKDRFNRIRSSSRNISIEYENKQLSPW